MNKPLVLALAMALLAAPLALAHEPRGTPKTHCESPAERSVHDYGLLPRARHDGATTSLCGSGDVLGDGHAEYGFGAWTLLLLVDSDGDWLGGGTVACFGEAGHHPVFGLVTVDDVTHGTGLSFIVAADTADPTGVGGGCGDFQDDVAISCTGACTPAFGPGMDGAYHVHLQGGTLGHLTS